VIWYVVIGVAIAVVGWIIANPPWAADAGPPPPPPQPPPPPNLPPVARLPPSPPAPGGPTTARVLRPGCNLPPVGETRFEQTHVIAQGNLSAQRLGEIAANLNLTPVEDLNGGLVRGLHLLRIDGGASVQDVIRSLCANRLGAQPNYLYALAQQEQEPVNSDQYAPQKLNLPEAHRLAKGSKILIAVIDSEVDASHPELAGAITANFDASADDEKPHLHGTGMAGAIAARRTMIGTAPQVGLLTVRAFSSKANGVEGTTFNILKGLDWAAAKGARIVNMSFAGPSDPRLREALLKANQKGMVLIAAAGNAGPKSPPLFPAADPNVIAVTATDTDDALFTGANRGDYIAVAAPGVDILAPAPDGTYQFTTGTSVAAAEVSGVVALLIERNPSLTPAGVRKILMDTAKHLGSAGRNRDFGAGLVNALQAVTAAKSPGTTPKPPAASPKPK
jgi:subtilisin family serine protease